MYNLPCTTSPLTDSPVNMLQKTGSVIPAGEICFTADVSLDGLLNIVGSELSHPGEQLRKVFEDQLDGIESFRGEGRAAYPGNKPISVSSRISVHMFVSIYDGIKTSCGVGELHIRGINKPISVTFGTDSHIYGYSICERTMHV
jgi:hypothetical protein